MWRVLALVAGCAAAAAAACSVAEWACRAGGCVRADHWCDGTAHCPDSSDEPPRCTPCNRTYYGLSDREYALTLTERHAGPGPFLCHVTFTAGGGPLGDLVQLAFDEFRVGRYDPDATERCPDGFASLMELGRPFTGGAWCGDAAKGALYFSETATVTLSLRVPRGAPQLRLRYRFLSSRSAVVRLGSPERPLERGNPAPGTYCTRAFSECHRRPCRLQSPNYPGMYPRNVTCYWTLRQKDVPTCKHAMISIRQEHSYKMQMKRSVSMARLNRTGRWVRAWGACGGGADRLVVYDGASTDDPVLLDYCGGAWLPPVTARGPDMLVAFHAAPHAAPPQPNPVARLRGFEIEVSVQFADSDSLEYAREARRCEFHVKAAAPLPLHAAPSPGPGGGRYGVLHAPLHTLPPNTTCTWTFHGRPGDKVWIYFSSFTHYSLIEPRREASEEPETMTSEPEREQTVPWVGRGGSNASPWARLREMLRKAPPTSPTPSPLPSQCAVEVALWEGEAGGGGSAVRYCDSAPALCARAALNNATRTVRPCAPPNDGVVSNSSLLSVSVLTRPGTATHPLRFALHYEFVEAALPGEPLVGRRAIPSECGRLVTLEGAVGSPRNVLWLGRGGAARIRCPLRMTAGAGRRTQLSLSAISLGSDGRCVTRLDPRTGRLACVPTPSAPVGPVSSPQDELPAQENEPEPDGAPPIVSPHLWIYDSTFPDFRMPLACICDDSAINSTVEGGSLEAELVARRLSPREDWRDAGWAGSWRRSASSTCPPPPAPPAGHALLTSHCSPLLFRAAPHHSVFVRVWGDELPLSLPPPAASTAPLAPDPPLCPTETRVLVYDAHTGRLLKTICPGDRDDGSRTVQLFSPEWWGGSVELGGALLVAVAGAGVARVALMEVWRGAGVPVGGGALLDSNATLAGCAVSCVELGACVGIAVRCDGNTDCPRGGDEVNCGARYWAALRGRGQGAAGAIGGALAAALIVLLLLRRRRRKSGRRPASPPPLLDS